MLVIVLKHNFRKYLKEWNLLTDCARPFQISPTLVYFHFLNPKNPIEPNEKSIKINKVANFSGNKHLNQATENSKHSATSI